MRDGGVDKVEVVKVSWKEMGEVGEVRLEEAVEMDGDGMRVGIGASVFIMGRDVLYIYILGEKNPETKGFPPACVWARKRVWRKGP